MTEQQKQYSCISNRWINTIFRGYGVIKQRIFREIIEQLQPQIKANFQKDKNTGKLITWVLPPGQNLPVELDMSKIMDSNNYYWVRKALDEMCSQPIDIYNDSAYSSFNKESYVSTHWLKWEPNKGRMVTLIIRKSVAELLINLEKKNPQTCKQFTWFAPLGNLATTCKYTYPLHMLISSYANRGGVSRKLSELRMLLGVTDLYPGFDSFNQKILKPVQEKLKKFGDFCFDYTTPKKGKEVTTVVFKIWPNKNKAKPDDQWIMIQKAIQEELPHFMKISPDKLEAFDYLMNGKYNLQEVYHKIQKVHEKIVYKLGRKEKVDSPFSYLLRSLHNDFPPPG